MIRAVKIGDKNGFLITKGGLAIGAAFLGAVIMGLIVGWIALGRTHSLSNEDRELVMKLQNISAYQKNQINEAREANCKLKLYDVLSGKAGTVLFKKAHVLGKLFEEGINHTLEVVESIPSAKNCTGIFSEPKGKNKKQTGGLTPSDIKYANKVLGEILEEPRGFQRRNESEVKKNIEHKQFLFPLKKKNHKKNSSKKKKNTVGAITNPTGPIEITPISPQNSEPAAAESSKHEKREMKKQEHEEKKQEKREEKCAIEVKVGEKIGLGQELKVCS